MSLIGNVLRASQGNSILIRADANSTRPFLILVDGRQPDCFQKKQEPKIIPGPLLEYLGTLAENNIVLDLVVMTHVDDDHIVDCSEPFKQKRIKRFDCDAEQVSPHGLVVACFEFNI